MKKCDVCGAINPDYSIFCWKCKHEFPLNQFMPTPQEKTYALREFLFKNQQLFMIMGVFLAIALFFNTANLLNFESNVTPPSISNSSQIQCVNEPTEVICLSKNFIDNTTDSHNTTGNLSYNQTIFCLNPERRMDCKINSSSLSLQNTNTQKSTFNILQLLTLICLIPFILISIMIIFDSFIYLTRMIEHAKNQSRIHGLADTIKDFSILLFIIPFFMIVTFFSLFCIIGWSNPSYQSLGISLITTFLSITYLLIIVFFSLVNLGFIEKNPTSKGKGVVVYLSVALGSFLCCILFQEWWIIFLLVSVICVAFAIFILKKDRKGNEECVKPN